MPLPTACVIHLVRAANGAAPFLRFARRYQDRAPGIEHGLVLVLKGFSNPAAFHRWQAVANLNAHCLYLPDEGCDLATYRAAATALSCDVCVFLNSFSAPLAADWLRHLAQPLLEDSHVGVVGATGSYESLRTPLSAIPLSRRYRFLSSLRRWLYRRRVKQLWKPFPPFPNPHLRTNGFAIRRRDWLDLSPRFLADKWSGWRLESGRCSMTRQMLRRDLQVLVVDRNGKTYQPADWWHSRTFRAGNQSHLLIADNQTRQFATATGGQRAALTEMTWGRDVAQQELESASGERPPARTARPSGVGVLA